MLIAPWTCRTIHTFWYWFGAVRKQAYLATGVLTMSTGTGIRRLRRRAFDRYGALAYDGYGYGRTVGTETGVHTGVQGKLYCDTYRTTKQKWVAGLACNFFLYDHSLMNNVMKIMNTLNRYWIHLTLGFSLCYTSGIIRKPTTWPRH